MSQASPYICKSEREFLALKGDGTESVKVTLEFDNPTNNLNGWYLFLKENEGNVFVKQSLTNLPLIDRLLCSTRYLQFDRNAGLLPNSFYCTYAPVGLGMNWEKGIYERFKVKLENVGDWKPIREVKKWEFVE